MVDIKLNHWIIEGNKLSTSLLRFYVEIYPYQIDKRNVYNLVVGGIDKKRSDFIFDTLEEAVSFTENVINSCQTYDDIRHEYTKYYWCDKPKTFIKKY